MTSDTTLSGRWAAVCAAADYAEAMGVLIVIVNYRTAALAIDCLRSLAPVIAQRPGTTVEIVDNASNDGSVEQILAAAAHFGWSDWVHVTPSTQNAGFAAGNNIALRPALLRTRPPEYFWLLNPDTTVAADALESLVRFLEENKRVGIAGSRIYDPGTPGPIAFRFPSLIGELENGLSLGVFSRLVQRWSTVQHVSDRPKRVDWVAGASMLVRREALLSAGPMDEQYFLYFEETDFCLQALRAGWTCWYVPSSHVTHFAGASTGLGGARTQPARRPKYWFDSRRRYFVKNHSRLYAAIVDLIWLAAHATRRLRKRLRLARDPMESDEYVADFIRHSALSNSAGIDDPKFSHSPRHARAAARRFEGT